MIHQSIKKNVGDFIDQLNTRREEMDAKRIVMSDTDFGRLYGVSSFTVSKYMGAMDKNIRYKSTIKFVPIAEINELRKTYTDSYIAQKYNSSLGTINRYFGSRESLGLSRYRQSGSSKKESTVGQRLEENKTTVGEFCWWYPVEKPYWEIDNKVELCIGAHPSLFLKIV